MSVQQRQRWSWPLWCICVPFARARRQSIAPANLVYEPPLNKQLGTGGVSELSRIATPGSWFWHKFRASTERALAHKLTNCKGRSRRPYRTGALAARFDSGQPKSRFALAATSPFCGDCLISEQTESRYVEWESAEDAFCAVSVNQSFGFL